MSLRKARIQLLNAVTGKPEEDLDIYSSPDAILFEDGDTLTQKLDSKVTVDGEATNVNFIESKIVQDGLIRQETNIPMNRQTTNPYSGYSIKYNYSDLKDENVFCILVNGVTSGNIVYANNISMATKEQITTNEKLLIVDINKITKKNQNYGYKGKNYSGKSFFRQFIIHFLW